jgi:hypothetical protein
LLHAITQRLPVQRGNSLLIDLPESELDSLIRRYAPSAHDLPRPLLAAEACTELGANAGPPPPGLLRRAVIAGLTRRREIVADERHRYEAAGAIGAMYHRNSLQMQLELMARIRALKEGAPMKRTLSTFLIALTGCLALVLGACGGGGTDEEPQPRPQVDCAKTPELCK